ncbi:hypothetical protein GCM10011369_12490 [Neiella marina]|uniref:Lipoprotein n=1 Tax=Neiella marina TaxID=508461 RepID=A0A8J2XNH9_9GAMM|nr:hypothetical protein [Neiella marina]GGA72225.1 hypothetical protein GCM10011369_12490 [Neiella marina]
MKKQLAALAILLTFGAPTQAGVYTDELAKCLVSSTSPQDRAALVRWMFIAASHHPAVKDIASVSSAQINDGNRSTADLFVKLMTESCREQTSNAVKFEGPIAIQGGFQVLGQVAGQELFTSPAVASAMADLQSFIDQEKIEAVLSPTATP